MMTERPSHWHVSLVVLQHQQRFFQAASLLVHQWPDEQHDQFAAMIALLGNMLWARSTYDAKNRDQEQLMAYAGATAGTFANQMAPSTKHKETLFAYLDQLEQQLLTAHDVLVTQIHQQVMQLSLEDCTPSKVNTMVWSTLFPDLPYLCGLHQIQFTLAERLRQAFS